LPDAGNATLSPPRQARLPAPLAGQQQFGRTEIAMGAQWKEKGKAAVADAKGKLFGKLVKDIMIAARGGADPKDNAKLRMTIEAARKVSMPKDTLDRAIK